MWAEVVGALPHDKMVELSGVCMLVYADEEELRPYDEHRALCLRMHEYGFEGTFMQCIVSGCVLDWRNEAGWTFARELTLEEKVRLVPFDRFGGGIEIDLEHDAL